MEIGISAHLPKIYSRKLVDLIFEKPYRRIGNLGEKQIAQRQAASRYLKELVFTDVLREAQVGKEKQFLLTQSSCTCFRATTMPSYRMREP